jgi:hypothetical protein
MGYYQYVRNGVTYSPQKILEEIDACLRINPWYRDEVVFLAGDKPASRVLESRGLEVVRTFEDAPQIIRDRSAHWMKHWMLLWAVREYTEALWLDWDTVAVSKPEGEFWTFARAWETPKFILIPRYKHALVNCGVVYVPHQWAGAMAQSFDAGIDSHNDEHLWQTVLPANILERPEFWWGERVRHVSGPHRVPELTGELAFAHTKDLGLADAIRSVVAAKVAHE